MSDISNCKVCPSWMNFIIDNPVRRWIVKPDKILSNYIKKGMTFLDLGCGGGTYSVAAAKLVGETGRVISLDIQEKMLAKVRTKIIQNGFENIVETHLAEQDKINLRAEVDFALAMCMVHETPNKQEFFGQVRSVLKDGSKMLVAEPTFHVSNNSIEKQIETAKNVGFKLIEKQKINFFCKGYLLEK